MQSALPSEAIPATGRGQESAWSRWRYLPRLWRLLWQLGPRELVFVAFVSVANGLVPLLVLAALRRLIDGAVAAADGTGSAQTAAFWLGALLAANALQSFAQLAGRWLGGDTQERLKARMQERLLTKASRLSLAAFERPAFHDQLLRAQKGLDTRLFSTLEHLLTLPTYLVTAVALLFYVGASSLFFPLILLAGLVPLHIIGSRYARRRYALEHSHTAAERVLHYMSELMTRRETAAEIRLFGLQSHLLGRRLSLFGRLRDDRLRLARAQTKALLGTTFGEQLTYGAVIVGVTALIARGLMSVGHFAAFLAAAERFRDASGMFLWSVRTVGDDLRYVADLLDYLDLQEEETHAARLQEEEPRSAPVHASAPTTLTDVPGGDGAFVEPINADATTTSPVVRFESVGFTYPGADGPALQAIDFTLRPGEHIALVGRNGAGKTTLAKLLLGLYRPTAGRITADSVNLAEIEPERWRAIVTAAFQDFVRYELTPRENIGFGDLRRLQDDGAVRAAAAKSGADRVVATLPLAYETPLGKLYDERGHELSVGQWQKLALARAHMRTAAVLVLDEPTASLDARAETDVFRQFHEMARGKSVLLISHRLVSARMADRVLLLDGGRIVEQGSHDELMRLGGQYALMYSAQAKWYQ